MTVPVRLAPAGAALSVIVASLAILASAAESAPATFGIASVLGHDDDYAYRLPYGDQVSYAIVQGYGGALSHRGAEFYTLDFGMPEGTPVFSAREGTVLAIEDRFDVSCWDVDCDRYANYVEILHADGTVGKYFHLQQDSVLVLPGQPVRRGQALARSGDTGLATAPHLHFGVYCIGPAGEEQSIAVRFAARNGVVERPRAGARYINAEVR